MHDAATDGYLELAIPIAARAGMRTEKCDLLDRVLTSWQHPPTDVEATDNE